MNDTLAPTAGDAHPSRRIVVIGDALIDELIDERGIVRVPGGSALNVASGLATLGLDVTLIAAIGDDEDGQRLRAALESTRVLLLPSLHPRGTVVASSTRIAGEPTYAFNESGQHRTLTLDAAQRAAIADADLVAISGFPFDDPQESQQLRDAVAGIHAPVAIDANPRSAMLSSAATFIDNFERTAAEATLVKIGAEDAALLYGESLDTVARRLKSQGVPMVLATSGAGGASLLGSAVATVRCDISTPQGPVLDSMGAGDATFASILADIAAGWSPHSESGIRILRHAMDIAAATCRNYGPALALPAS